MAGLVCGTIAWLHYQELHIVEDTLQQLDNFRQAQLDLSKGFIRLILSRSTDAPLNQQQGLALLDQAFSAFEEEGSLLGRGSDDAAQFRQELDAFRAEVASLPAGAVDTRTWVRLWIDFDHLESRTETLDQQSLADLSSQSEASNNLFGWTLVVAILLFGGVGVGVYQAGRARHRAELRQRESEAHFRSVVEDQTELICRYDRDFRLTFVNTAYAQAFGVRPQDMIGRVILDRIPPSDRERAIAHIQALTPQNPVATSEHQSVMLDDAVRWYQWTDRALLDDAGNIVEYQGVGRDITKRLLAEKAVVESERMLRLFVEHAPAAIAMLDTDMRYILVSRRWLSDFGLTESDLLGRSHYEVFTDIPDRWREIHRRCLNGAVESSEADVFPRADGRIDWLRWEVRPWHNAADQIGGIIIFSEVITRRVESEAAVRQSEIRYRLLAENMADVVWTLNLDTLRFSYVSPSVEQLRGYTPEEVLQQPMEAVVTPASYAEITRELPERLRAFQAGSAEAVTRRDEIEQTCKDGSTVWTEVVTRLLVDEAGAVQLLGVSRDITERRHAEERIRNLNRTMSVLSDVNQAIVRTRDLIDLYREACRIAVQSGGYLMAWIGLRDPETGRIQPVAHAGAKENYLEQIDLILDDSPDEQVPAVTVLRTGAHVICNDIERDSCMEYTRDFALRLGYRAMAALPLRVEGEIRGVVSLYASEPDFFDGEEMRLLDEMAGDISYAMEFAGQDAARHEAEAALRASEENYRNLVESSDAAISVFNATGTLLYANRVAADALSLTPEAAVGRRMGELFPPEVAHFQLEGVREVIRTGEGKVSEAASFIQGAPRWYRSSVQPVRDTDGSVTAALINAVDITLLKQAEAVLRESRDALEKRVEERTADLQAEKARVEAILNNSPVGVLLVSTDLHIRQKNPAFRRLFGVEVGELLDKPLQMLFHPDDVASVIERAEAARAGQAISLIEARAMRKNGETFDAEVRFGLITGDGLVCVIEDITRRKAQERLLRYQAALQQNVTDAVIVADMDFRIQSWNHAAETIYGWSAEEAQGRHVSKLLQTVYEDESARQRTFDDFLARGAWHAEVVQHRKDGSTVNILSSVSLVRDENGASLGIVAVNRDNSERKQAEQALRESEQQYRLLAENVIDVIVKTSMDGIITYVTPSIHALLGFTPDDLVGRPAAEFVFPDDLPESRTTAKSGLTVPSASFTVNQRMRHADGHFVPVEITNQVVRDPVSGEPLEYIGVARDITERKQAEQALRESESRFRRAIVDAPFPIMIHAEDGAIIHLSKRWTELSGYSHDEIPTMNDWTQRAYGEQSQSMKAVIDAVYARTEPRRGGEFHVRTKSGEDRVWDFITAPLGLMPDGRRMVSSMAMDVTERKHAEEALRESEQMLSNVIDNIPVRLFWKDVHSVYQGCNTLHARHIGLDSRDMIVGRTDDDFVPGRASEWAEADRRVIETGVPILNVEEFTNNAFEPASWMRFSKVPLRNARGEPRGVLVTVEDITERKRAEEALRTSEQRYRSLVETMRGGLATFDTEQRYTFVNERFCQLLGYTSEEIIGKMPTDFVDAAGRAATERQLAQRRRGEPTSYETAAQRKDGDLIHLLVSSSPLLDSDGHFVGSLVVATDISVQKQAEQLLREALAKEKELGELKTRFVSMASHEFRTPLATILALVETLSAYRRKLPDDQIDQRFDKIKEQVGHLKDIMDDVLLLARMQSRRVEFNPTGAEPDALCRSILDEFQSQPDIMHRIDYRSTGTQREAMLDRKLMRQIISNLVSNAIKYSPAEKPISVYLDTSSTEIVLKVADQGIGIPEADLPHLFEPFHRAANVGTISGTGLGLVVTKESVELHQGTIEVESHINAGTTFTVRIPIVTNDGKDNNENPGD